MAGVDLTGWRGRIGLIVPDSLVPTEPWFHRMAPRGVVFLTTRMTLGKKATPDTLRKMKEDAIRASLQLANAEVDLICYCCTSGSFIEGVGYDQKIIDEIELLTGIPTTTTTTSFTKALSTLNIKSLLLVTPYIESINTIEKNFLENVGFNTVKILSRNMENVMEYTMTPGEEIYRLIKTFSRTETGFDGVFISCMSMNVMDIISVLENDIQKPVVTSNQATLWNVLRTIGVSEPITGYGNLLTSY